MLHLSSACQHAAHTSQDESKTRNPQRIKNCWSWFFSNKTKNIKLCEKQNWPADLNASLWLIQSEWIIQLWKRVECYRKPRDNKLHLLKQEVNEIKGNKILFPLSDKTDVYSCLTQHWNILISENFQFPASASWCFWGKHSRTWKFDLNVKKWACPIKHGEVMQSLTPAFILSKRTSHLLWHHHRPCSRCRKRWRLQLHLHLLQHQSETEQPAAVTMETRGNETRLEVENTEDTLT